MSTRVTSGPTGWAVFAGTVLAIVGAFNVIYGLAAIFRDEVITTTGSAVIVWDVTKWGWILLIFGIFQILAGMALFAGTSWARWTAVVLAGLNAIGNIGFLTVQPFVDGADHRARHPRHLPADRSVGGGRPPLLREL